MNVGRQVIRVERLIECKLRSRFFNRDGSIWPQADP